MGFSHESPVAKLQSTYVHAQKVASNIAERQVAMIAMIGFASGTQRPKHEAGHSVLLGRRAFVASCSDLR